MIQGWLIRGDHGCEEPLSSLTCQFPSLSSSIWLSCCHLLLETGKREPLSPDPVKLLTNFRSRTHHFFCQPIDQNLATKKLGNIVPCPASPTHYGKGMIQGFPGSMVVKNPSANTGDAKDMVQSLGQEDTLEEEMATNSSIPSWESPWTEEPGGL